MEKQIWFKNLQIYCNSFSLNKGYQALHSLKRMRFHNLLSLLEKHNVYFQIRYLY